MNSYFMTDGEVAKLLGERIRTFRVASSGGAMIRQDLAIQAGISVSSLERLEKGENTRLLTVISVLRELGLLDELVHLVPDMSALTPMQIIENERPKRQRAYAPRKKKLPP